MSIKRKSSAVRNRVVKTPTPFTIVGIGASAGGLEALELFVAQIPIDSKLAFVIIQHQDPTHKGMLVELLQHRTLLPIYQIEDRMQVMPNCIYVIPPGFDLTIRRNNLHLQKPKTPRGLRLPINLFFSSLAEDKNQLSVGVILSGMGSDGTLGVRAIKEKGGAVFVEEPSLAKFDSMPRSVIHSGFFDVVAPAEELPGKIINHLQYPALSFKGVKSAYHDQNAIANILSLISAETGHDFSLYKKNTLYRRIERRMELYQLSSIQDYAQYLNEHVQEINLLFKELLIGVTHFFRDPLTWEQLKNDILPTFFSNNKGNSTLRAWVTGCSTGEEAYSLAIIFKEALEALLPTKKNFSLQIFATDLDKDAIDKARQGIFPKSIIDDVSEARLQRYFTEVEHGYKINKDIRDMMIFAPQNIILDPPFTKIDILTCRNLLIYLDPELQKKLLHLFHYSLNPNGILMLGSAETIGGATYLFSAFPGKTRLYRRLDSPRTLEHSEFPSSSTSYPRNLTDASIHTPSRIKINHFPPNLKMLVESLLLQLYSLPAVLATEQGDILYIHGQTGKYLEPATGKANLNVFAMAREGLKQALSESFQKAFRQQSSITLKAVKVRTNGHFQGVDIIIHPLALNEEFTKMILIIFKDVEILKEVKKINIKPGKDSDRVTALLEELQYSQKTLQITREEMQNSQEDLKSANEELQSTNEELQSANEELTTSKEEMQSMNEELQTVNNELQAKIDELSSTSNDMHNLLNSTDIAILFLDEGLKVRRFTNQVTNIIKLIPGDTGRQITDLVSELEYPSLTKDAQEVLRTLIFKETQVPTHDDRWFIVRIMPYRTLENKIDGVVITFTDVTVSKKLELELRKTQRSMKKGMIPEKNGPKRQSKTGKTRGKKS